MRIEIDAGLTIAARVLCEQVNDAFVPNEEFWYLFDSVEESRRFERALCGRFSQNDGGLSQRESFRSE